MRLFLFVMFFWVFGLPAQASSLCGPQQTIGEQNLQALIATSAKSYARSSSKENVLLQALMRDKSYFKKIFPKRDPKVVGGYYFHTVCKGLLEKDGANGKIDAFGIEKLKYVSKAFGNLPETQKILASLQKATAASPKKAETQKSASGQASSGFETTVAELPEKKPGNLTAGPSGFGKTKVETKTTTVPSGFATSVDAVEAKPEEKKSAAAQKKVEATSEVATESASEPDAGASSGMPAVVPFAIPQESIMSATPAEPAKKEPDVKPALQAQSSNEPTGQAAEKVAEEAPSSGAPSLSELVSQVGEKNDSTKPPKQLQSALSEDLEKQKQGGDASGQADNSSAGEASKTEFDLTTGSSTDGQPTPPKVLASPSCIDMQIGNEEGCQRFQSMLTQLKAVPLSLTYDKAMKPQKRFRVSLTFQPNQADMKDLLSGGSSKASHMLQANLFGSAFDVEPKGPQKRVLNSYETIKWTWFVTPLQEGADETLGLDFDAVVQVNGGLLQPVTIKSYRNDIAVATDWWDPVVLELEKFDPIFLGIAGLFFVVMLLAGLRRVFRSRVPHETDELSEPVDYAKEIASFSSVNNQPRSEATMFLVSENNNR